MHVNQLGISNPKIGPTSKGPEQTPGQTPAADTFSKIGLGRAIHLESFRILVSLDRTLYHH